jgi:hypothetical protein
MDIAPDSRTYFSLIRGSVFSSEPKVNPIVSFTRTSTHRLISCHNACPTVRLGDAVV